MKKVFTIVLCMAFLLLCGIPAMAQTVEGPGYAAGSVGQYTYDPYTGQVDVSWSTAYGVNVYGNPATTTTTANVTRGTRGVLINSRNETANGRSYSSGQTTDGSRYSNACRTEVTEEVNVAASDVDICGTSEFYLEAWAESAHTEVGIAQADGSIEVNHSAYNAGDSSAEATFTATSVTDYEGGAFADADIAQVGQEVGMAADVFASAMAENGEGYMASVTFEGDSVVDLEQQATAADDEVEAVQEAGLATATAGTDNVVTFTNTASADGHEVTTTTSATLVTGYNGSAAAASGTFNLNPALDITGSWVGVASVQSFGLAEDVTATTVADSAGGNHAESSTTAIFMTDYASGGVAGEGEATFNLPLALPISTVSGNIDGAATGQAFGFAAHFSTTNSSESAGGAEAYANATGLSATNVAGGAAAVTGSVSWNPTVSFDLAAAGMVTGPFDGGPNGSLEWGAEDASGNDTAQVSITSGFWKFRIWDWSAGAAAAGSIGPVNGAGAGVVAPLLHPMVARINADGSTDDDVDDVGSFRQYTYGWAYGN